VVGDDLDEFILVPGQLGHPVRAPRVELRPSLLREPSVRHVPDQRVLELELPFVRDAGFRVGVDQVANLEPAHRFDDAIRGSALEVTHQAGPEDQPDDGRQLGESTIVGGQEIEPRVDEALDAPRDRHGVVVAPVLGRRVELPRLREHPDRLLEEQWVAGGRAQDRVEPPAGERAVGDERVDQGGALLCAERPERDRRAMAVGARAGPRVDELRTSGAQGQDRTGGAAVHFVEQLEEAGLGPVQILEQKDQRPTFRAQFEQPPDPPVELAVRDRRGLIGSTWSGRRGHQGGQRGRDRPELVGVVRRQVLDQGPELP
jgi:hypothetical protein